MHRWPPQWGAPFWPQPSPAAQNRSTGAAPAAAKDGDRPILLLNMPWATTVRPAIPLGILSSICEEEGMPREVFYPNFDMTASLGVDHAVHFSDDRRLFGLGEHLFAVDIFGREVLESDAYLPDVVATLQYLSTPEDFGRMAIASVPYLRWLRDQVVPSFLTTLQQRVLALRPAVVGFTATFNQVMPSLALAARLKRADPSIVTIFGGACFDGDMGREYHRALPQVIDHVFIGEAEVPFRAFLRRVRHGEPTAGIPGTTWSEDGKVQFAEGTPLFEMDTSPSPDYEPYFRERERVRAATGVEVRFESLTFESSRGCWWGQKNQCTFCGINPDIMPFRAKSLDLVIDDIRTMSERYGVTKFTASDWIMSHWHADELFRRLEELHLDLEIFYELRADMNKEQMQRMRKAGITLVQPGIESLSTPLLKLMKKGTTAIRQVQFIRWARELGIHLSYNFLTGFPDEDPQWYVDMAKLIPHIRHLQPPVTSTTTVELHRFAPLYEEREKFGIDDHRLRRDYRHNFPPGLVDEQKVGYFFDFRSSRIPAAKEHLVPLTQAVEPWVRSWAMGTLPRYDYTLGAGFVKITDLRGAAPRHLYLTGLHRDVMLLCDSVQSRRTLTRDLGPLRPQEISDGMLDRVVDELVQGDVLLAEGPWLLTLPTAQHPRMTSELRAIVLGGAPKEEPVSGEPEAIAV